MRRAPLSILQRHAHARTLRASFVVVAALRMRSRNTTTNVEVQVWVRRVG